MADIPISFSNQMWLIKTNVKNQKHAMFVMNISYTLYFKQKRAQFQAIQTCVKTRWLSLRRSWNQKYDDVRMISNLQ